VNVVLTRLPVANTPAEVTHLLEEIQAKDHQILAYKDEINKRDAALQKWVRLNGGHVPNPKEDAFSKTINDCFDKCEILQAEKCGLSEKALIVLERQIKKLDVGLRHLTVREEFPADWNGPSMLSGSATGTSTPVSGGPLQIISGNIGSTGGAPNIANAAQLRMAHSSAGARSGAQTPVSAPRSVREGSAEANKRRRVGPSEIAIPIKGSHLKPPTGPGTPKASTPVPGASSSRAGSAQPSRPAHTKKVLAPPNRKPVPANSSRTGKRSGRTGSSKVNGDRRRQLARAGRDGTPSTNASVTDSEDGSASPTPSSLARTQADGAGDRASDGEGEEDLEEGEDTTLYCFCQKVSFGDMVGCDNDNCKYQWFHWSCVGLKSEPAGEWLCPECRKLPKGELAVSK
jgi:inhibitor of growth protein 3